MSIFALSLLFSNPYMHADSIENEPEIMICQEAIEQPLVDRHSYVRKMVNHAHSTVHLVLNRIRNLLSKKNNEPVAVHAQNIHRDLDEIDQTLIKPLQQEIELIEHHMHEDYSKLLRNILVIINAFHKNLAHLHQVLEKNKTTKPKDAMRFGNDLMKVEQTVERDLGDLNNSIRDLYALLLKFDIELAQTIHSLRTTIKTMIQKEDTSKLAMLGIIKHRLKCS